MNLASRFNSLLHLSLLLGALAFVTADDKPLLALLAIGATLASWIISRATRLDVPLALPRTAINVLVLGVIVHAAVRASGNTLNEDFVSTLGQFLVFVLLVKMLDRRAPRDDAQLITLSVFIAIASVLTSSSFGVGLILMAFVPVVVATAMMWQLRAGEVMMATAARENAPPGSPPNSPPSVPSHSPPALVSGRHPRRAFVGVCLSSVFAASAIATAVFVFVPRGIGGDFLGRFGTARQAQIGFRESVRLGESGFLSENPTPVMDIRITTAGGEALGGDNQLLYFRGAARDRYDPVERVWQDSTAASTRGQINTQLPYQQDSFGATGSGTKLKAEHRWRPHIWGTPYEDPGGTPPSRATFTRVQRITVRAESAGGNMFCLWRPIAVTPDRTVDVAFSRNNGTMRHTSPPGPAFAYTVESTLTDDLCRAPAPPEDFRSGPIHDLASGLLAQAKLGADATSKSSRQTVTALRDHLRSTYLYTLEMVAPPENVDPIEFFLFDRKKGHCEYFASAMAAMCQSVGVPCRVVTGYLASEFNTLTGQYLVRESNAHAWVEAFVTLDPESGEGRWETFDASPPGDIERLHRPAGGVLARLRSWYDALEFGWSSSVIGYDNATNQRQRTAGTVLNDDSLLAARFSAIADRLVVWIKTVRADPSLIPWWVRFAPFAAITLVVVWLFFRRALPGLGRARNRNLVRAAHGLSPLRPTGFYAKSLRVLAKAGVAKPDHTPPARFASTLRARSPEAANHFRDIALAFYRVRFSGNVLAPAETAAADDLVRRLEAALKHAHSCARP